MLRSTAVFYVSSYAHFYDLRLPPHAQVVQRPRIRIGLRFCVSPVYVDLPRLLRGTTLSTNLDPPLRPVRWGPTTWTLLFGARSLTWTLLFGDRSRHRHRASASAF